MFFLFTPVTCLGDNGRVRHAVPAVAQPFANVRTPRHESSRLHCVWRREPLDGRLCAHWLTHP